MRVFVAVFVALWLGAIVVSTAGCGEVQCGDGTHEEAGECTASLPPQCGSGTELVSGACVPTEGGARCGLGTHLEAGECVADIDVSGNAGRFYEVDLIEPTVLVNLAGPPLHDSFLSGENLFFIGAYEPTSADLRVYGGGGMINDDGSYTLDRAGAFDTPAARTSGVFATDPFVFRLSFVGAAEPVTLVDTVISNGTTTSPDGVTLVQAGELNGVLTPAAAQLVYIEAANLSLREILVGIGAAPDVDHDGDGTPESWTFSLDFSTIPVWVF